MEVDVVGDDDAYLRLVPSSEYASYTDNDTLQIHFTENSTGGQGLNTDADSEFTDVFRIQNQGTQEVKTWIDLAEINDQLSSGYVTSWITGINCSTESGLDQDTGGDWDNSPEGIGVRLNPGEWVSVAIQFVDISEDVVEELDGTVPVNAAAEDSNVFDEVGFSGTTSCDS